jgi:hypothetical protein
LCIYCDKYKCARPYLLKEHIKKCHPDIDPNTSLEEATRIAGSHKATMVASDLLRERGSSPTPELNGSHGDEAQSHRLVLPSLPITQALPASLPVVPTVHCDPQSYARTPFSFTEEHPQTTRDSDLTYVRLAYAYLCIALVVLTHANLTGTQRTKVVSLLQPTACPARLSPNSPCLSVDMIATLSL